MKCYKYMSMTWYQTYSKKNEALLTKDLNLTINFNF